MIGTLADQAHRRIEAGLRPRTSKAYTATSKIFLAFVIYMGLSTALSSRKVQLLLKSVHMNAKMNVEVKGVITIEMLKKLMKTVQKYYNGVT